MQNINSRLRLLTLISNFCLGVSSAFYVLSGIGDLGFATILIFCVTAFCNLAIGLRDGPTLPRFWGGYTRTATFAANFSLLFYFFPEIFFHGELTLLDVVLSVVLFAASVLGFYNWFKEFQGYEYVVSDDLRWHYNEKMLSKLIFGTWILCLYIFIRLCLKVFHQPPNDLMQDFLIGTVVVGTVIFLMWKGWSSLEAEEKRDQADDGSTRKADAEE